MASWWFLGGLGGEQRTEDLFCQIVVQFRFHDVEQLDKYETDVAYFKIAFVLREYLSSNVVPCLFT